jgi:hypothetical protein
MLEDLSIEDFVFEREIDCGSFGKVIKVKRKTDEKRFAMKRIRKDKLII